MPDTRVEDELAAATLTGAEILYCVQAGGPRRTTVDGIAAYAANPPTSDGRALGSTGLRWSDLFMATGGVIDVGGSHITHIAGPAFSFDANISAGFAINSLYNVPSTDPTTGAITAVGGIGALGDINWGGAAATAFTPTVSGGGGAITATCTGIYKDFGKLRHIFFKLVITANTATGWINVNLPNAAAAFDTVGSASWALLSGAQGVMSIVLAAGQIQANLMLRDGTVPVGTGTVYGHIPYFKV